ncbi:MAG: carboxypeptidase regulatory-like domain-containing protein, partial [Bryobacteraceae bacterium]
TGIDSSNTGSLSGAIRADCVAPGHVNGTSQPLATGGYQWFDASNSIYAQPANGTFGNCGVGTVRGPGLHTMDLSLSKKFNITERQNLEFRAEAINFTNTPILNMSDWGGNDYLGSTLGQVTQSQGARNIQFGLKYNF